MTNISTKLVSQPAAETAVHLLDNWFDPIETGPRDRVREFIHAMIEGGARLGAVFSPHLARPAKVGLRRAPSDPHRLAPRHPDNFNSALHRRFGVVHAPGGRSTRRRLPAKAALRR